MPSLSDFTSVATQVWSAFVADVTHADLPAGDIRTIADTRRWRVLLHYDSGAAAVHVLRQHSDDHGATWTTDADVITGGLGNASTPLIVVQTAVASFWENTQALWSWLTFNPAATTPTADTVQVPQAPITVGPTTTAPAGDPPPPDPPSPTGQVGVAWRALVVWEDALGRKRTEYYDCDTLDGAEAVVQALLNCSNAFGVQWSIGPLEGEGGDISGDEAYASVDDLAAVLVDAGDEPTQHAATFNVPAPKASLFQADQTTLDPAAGAVAALYATLVAHGLSYQQAPVTRVVIGLRDSHGPGGRA